VNSSAPRAIFGDALCGDALVRFIYVDEAGTSRKEPVTVVTGLIVHADSQWMPTANRILELHREMVPPRFLTDDFVFHAKSIWGDKKYRGDWDEEQRFRYLCEMMYLPWTLGLTLAFSTVPRGMDPGFIPPGFSREQTQHATAFGACMAAADKYIREECHPNELATIVAEDVEDFRSGLRQSMALIRANPRIIPASAITSVETYGGAPFRRLPDGGMDYRITRIVDDVHFSAKREATLLQIADACAFGLRRYHSVQYRGTEFIKAIYGDIPPPVMEATHQTIGILSGNTVPAIRKFFESSSGPPPS